MSSMHNYEAWLDSTYGLMPHRTDHPHSFNNIVFSTELLLAKQTLGVLTADDISCYLAHVHLNTTPDGLYAPKNSHDNITAKIAGLIALESGKIKDVKLSAAIDGKHFRDRILYGFWLSNNPLYAVLLPLALADIVRAILDSGKVRPKWWEKENFMFRLKAKLGILKPYSSGPIFGGRAEYYNYNGQQLAIRYLQNDGKIINLLRLYVLKQSLIFKPFVKFCKWLYVKKMGVGFQSTLFANYFTEYDHPVRDAYRQLDAVGKTVLD